ncbi:MAG: hypothetical protein N2039_12080 [Gemmataceae bacterium]|nr:hypothetical protein [Gemmataceae bacterium]
MNAEQKEKLDDYHFMFGMDAGNLAMALEQLTDVMAMVGQHKVHCRVEKGPRAGEPPLDLVELLETIESAKALVQETMLRLRQKS